MRNDATDQPHLDKVEKRRDGNGANRTLGNALGRLGKLAAAIRPRHDAGNAGIKQRKETGEGWRYARLGIRTEVRPDVVKENPFRRREGSIPNRRPKQHRAEQYADNGQQVDGKEHPRGVVNVLHPNPDHDGQYEHGDHAGNLGGAEPIVLVGLDLVGVDVFLLLGNVVVVNLVVRHQVIDLLHGGLLGRSAVVIEIGLEGFDCTQNVHRRSDGIAEIEQQSQRPAHFNAQGAADDVIRSPRLDGTVGGNGTQT
mmetsp:Transcript_32137/g.69638  ORF Transcript_32137/g.69638 Transcript_32137/m.69638 type:complete len:254 (-) Transcript_32137:142-903(-)